MLLKGSGWCRRYNWVNIRKVRQEEWLLISECWLGNTVRRVGNRGQAWPCPHSHWPHGYCWGIERIASNIFKEDLPIFYVYKCLPLWMSVNHVGAVPVEARRSCQLPGWCWEPNLDSLEKAISAFKTTEPSLHPQIDIDISPTLLHSMLYQLTIKHILKDMKQKSKSPM